VHEREMGSEKKVKGKREREREESHLDVDKQPFFLTTALAFGILKGACE
jgi:hypothetical protein